MYTHNTQNKAATRVTYNTIFFIPTEPPHAMVTSNIAYDVISLLQANLLATVIPN